MKLRGLLALGALCCYCWLEACTAELGYQESGWRPRGQTLNSCCFPPAKMKTTKQQRKSMTTPRSREQTTPRNSNDDDDHNSTVDQLDNGHSPALAVANSFAFNRPIYVYNAYPYRFYKAYVLGG